MNISLLEQDNTSLVIIDVQEKLLPVMGRGDLVVDNITKLIHLAKLYDLPITITEQYKKWLGPTVPAISELTPDIEPIGKMDFNCCAVESFNHHIKELNRNSIILVGVEAHICVFQTCISLLQRGYEVHAVIDAVDSRTEDNLSVGLNLMKEAGAIITSTEAVIYQIMKRGGTDEFRRMLKLIK